MSDRVTGLKAVANYLGCSVATVKRLLRRRYDPERFRCGPLRMWRAEHEREPWTPRVRLDLFRRRWREPESPELLATVVHGWIHIANIARMSVDRAQELSRREHDPLPVWHTRTNKVRALPCALRDWYDAQQRQHVEPPFGEFRGGPTRREDVCPPVPARRSRRAA